jgi:hypothetical protein
MKEKCFHPIIFSDNSHQTRMIKNNNKNKNNPNKIKESSQLTSNLILKWIRNITKRRSAFYCTELLLAARIPLARLTHRSTLIQVRNYIIIIINNL